MPNYCFNTLTISGNQKNLNDFLTKNENIEEGEELDFSKSVPVPSDCYMGDLGPDERKQFHMGLGCRKRIHKLVTQ